MRSTIGVLRVTLKYAFRRGNIIYYQRPVPKDLQDRYPGKLIKVSLGTGDIRAAADKITRLNREVEAEWSLMRGNPEATPKTIRGKAEEILGKFGLSPAPADNDPNARDLFYGHLDAKRERFAAGDEHAYRDNPADEYLSPAEIKAAQLLAGAVKPTLSDALELYLKVHPKRDDEQFAKGARIVFKTLTDAIGDKVIADLSRSDAHAYVTAEKARGVKTGTIDRYMNTIRAVIGTWLREKEIDRTNPFTKVPIPGNGEDTKKRQSLTEEELRTVLTACKAKDDDVRWLVAILADTGARMAEITGLALADLVLDVEVPHVIIQPHPWRSLKNDSSARTVPLLGHALWAAQRVKEKATKTQRFAFPRYTDAEETRATHASNTVAKWIRGLKIDGKSLEHTAHDLRHTMTDRLREVQCPEDIRLAIGGWASKGVGNKYGTGYGLKVKADWLAKVTI
ncbi:DUF6538 domain-containing protein [Ralstonia pseudosolanacearum]|uniref:DUF6538 domain-containing protein n=1 Tax=Ralstonia pseudosolanacearum TaxID=1310165 RepID=UPI002675CCDE|nr:DUF6538 domain-containing protein [Ralstonia pseudosolanacearum]MDO3559588.1 tyrosine-type recombinase/integrase [Ralstonia pseudosolanacearum]